MRGLSQQKGSFISKLIALTKGQSAIVDDADFAWLSQWKWYAQVNASGGFYAARKDSSRALIYMHRLINRTPDGLVTDHKDGDGLNNRRANLRTASQVQNMMNRRGKKRGTSKFKGVYLSTGTNKSKVWAASIRIAGKPKFLGRFATEQDAAAAYAAAANIHFGEFSNIQTGAPL